MTAGMLLAAASFVIAGFLQLKLDVSRGRIMLGGTGTGTGRDLARICPACLLSRQFPENLFFGLAKISMMNFQFLHF